MPEAIGQERLFSPDEGIGVNGQRLSIVIPNYNGAATIAETIQSLQEQGDCISAAEIIVLDNCSTDNSEEVIRRCWGDRIEFRRNPSNIGLIGNFNACLTAGSRDWLHIVHNDDLVINGAYQEVQQCLLEFPDAEAIYGRNTFMNNVSNWYAICAEFGPGRRGRLDYSPNLWHYCPVQFIGCFLSRKAIEKVGGFDTAFGPATDWHFWWRIARDVETIYTNRCIGAYRLWQGNLSAHYEKTGENIENYAYVLDAMIADFQKAKPLSRQEIQSFCSYKYDEAVRQCSHLIYDPVAFSKNINALKKFPAESQSRAAMFGLFWRYTALQSRYWLSRRLKPRRESILPS